MPILVRDIKIGVDEPEETAFSIARKQLQVSEAAVRSMDIYKKSLDARKKHRMQFVVTVLVSLKEQTGEALCRRLNQKNIVWQPDTGLTLRRGSTPLKTPVYVAGFGPAGIFCAYLLAQEGYAPIVLERGLDVDSRTQAVQAFWETGKLDPECNVQFGEGGAGTFSDGKLTTRISDERCRYILKLFREFGAPEEILKKAKPHIGTDYLRKIVKQIRLEIIRLGGEVRFGSRLEQVHVSGGRLSGITVNGERMPAEHLVLAVGHSARDTFRMLAQSGVSMQAKSFSVGVRIEHLQSEIEKGLYGTMAGHPGLPPGEYQLSHRQNGKGVYTFCMCPGGLVVPSSSEGGGVVTNGMSEFARDRSNANSALVVSVDSSDFGSGVFAGMDFQRQLEQRAFELGGRNYSAPASTVRGFLSGTPDLKLGRVVPSYALGAVPAEFRKLFPSAVIQMLEQGLQRFERKISGFSAPDAVLTGAETRTSSPVRVPRDAETLCSVSARGLYPCGEGAGYAGGIMSAAVDGVRVAERIIAGYCKN